MKVVTIMFLILHFSSFIQKILHHFKLSYTLLFLFKNYYIFSLLCTVKKTSKASEASETRFSFHLYMKKECNIFLFKNCRVVVCLKWCNYILYIKDEKWSIKNIIVTTQDVCHMDLV